MPTVLSRLGRVLKIGAVIGAAAGVVRMVRGRGRSTVTGEASWQPLRKDEPKEEARPAAEGWVEPVDGTCPASHPVKGNVDSGIYHVPGGAFYARTVPERCYATAEAAEADGFRGAKR